MDKIREENIGKHNLVPRTFSWKLQQVVKMKTFVAFSRNDTKSRKYDVILEELKTGFEDTKEFHTNKMKEELESRIE